MSKRKRSVYRNVISITRAHMGPDAAQAVGLLLLYRLHKEPSQVTRSDVDRLLEALGMAALTFSGDSDAVEKYLLDVKLHATYRCSIAE